MRNLIYFMVITAMVVSTNQVQADNLLINGSFEQGNLVSDPMSLPVGSHAITGWTIINAEVAWGYRTDHGMTPSDGSLCLDLSGYHDSFPFGGIEQSIPTTIGQLYRLDFDLGLNTVWGSNATLTASANENSTTFNLNASSGGMQWQGCGFDFIATSSNTIISFVGTNPSGRCIGLDNASVTPVPEPNSFVLLMMGALSLTFVWCQRYRG